MDDFNSLYDFHTLFHEEDQTDQQDEDYLYETLRDTVTDPPVPRTPTNQPQHVHGSSASPDVFDSPDSDIQFITHRRRGIKRRKGTPIPCDLDDAEDQMKECLKRHIKEQFECTPIHSEDTLSGWEFYQQEMLDDDGCYETTDAFLDKYNCSLPLTNAAEYEINTVFVDAADIPNELKNIHRPWRFTKENIHPDYLPLFRRPQSDEILNWGSTFFQALQYNNEIIELLLGEIDQNLHQAWRKLKHPETPETLWHTSMETDFQAMLNTLPRNTKTIIRPESDDVYVLTSSEVLAYASELCGRLGGIPAAPEHPVVLEAILTHEESQVWAPGKIIEGFDKGKEEQTLDTIFFPHGTARGYTAASNTFPIRNPYFGTVYCEELCNVMYLEADRVGSPQPQIHIHPRPCDEKHPLLCRLPNYRNLPLLRVITTMAEFTTHRLMSQFQRNFKEFTSLRTHLQEILQPCSQALLDEVTERRIAGRINSGLWHRINELTSSIRKWEGRRWDNIDVVADFNDVLQEANQKLTSVAFALGHDLFLGCRTANSQRVYFASRAPGSKTDSLFKPSLKEFDKLPTSGVAMEVFMPLVASWPKVRSGEETEDYVKRVAKELTKNLRLYSINQGGQRTQRINLRNILPVQIPSRVIDFVSGIIRGKSSLLSSTTIDGATPVVMRPTAGLENTMIAVENQDRARYRVTMSCDNPRRRDTSPTAGTCNIETTDTTNPNRRIQMSSVQFADFDTESQSIIEEGITDEISRQYAVEVGEARQAKDLINESIQRTRHMFDNLEPRQLLGLLHHIRMFDLGFLTQLEMSYGILAVIAALIIWLSIVQLQVRMLACENNAIWTSVYFATGKNPTRYMSRDWTFSRLSPTGWFGWFNRKLPTSPKPAKILKLEIGKVKSDKTKAKAKEKYDEKIEMEERVKQTQDLRRTPVTIEQATEETSFLDPQPTASRYYAQPTGTRTRSKSNLKRTQSRDSLALEAMQLKQNYSLK